MKTSRWHPLLDWRPRAFALAEGGEEGDAAAGAGGDPGAGAHPAEEERKALAEAAAKEAEGGEEKASLDPDADGLLAAASGDAKKAEEGAEGKDGKGAEGKDGKGAEKPKKPEGLPDHIWDAKRGEVKVDDLLKAYQGARRELSKGKKPDVKEAGEYQVEPPEGVALKPDDQVLEGWRRLCFENGVGQEAFQGLTSGFLGMLKDLDLLQPPFDAGREMELLGGEKEALPLMQGMAAWAKKLREGGILSQDEYEEMKIAGGTAHGLSMLAKLRELAGEKPIPRVPVGDGSGRRTLAEIEADVASERYRTDPEFRARIERELEGIVGTEASGSARVL